MLTAYQTKCMYILANMFLFEAVWYGMQVQKLVEYVPFDLSRRPGIPDRHDAHAGHAHLPPLLLLPSWWFL